MRSNISIVFCGLLCLVATGCFAKNTPVASIEQQAQTVRLPYSAMQHSKLQAMQGDENVIAAIAALDKAASDLLEIPLFTIVNKGILPASKNKHDYFSFGPYWWPDPDKADGKPWIRMDGKINPASREPNQDKIVFMQFNNALQTLALAYFFTEKQVYADKTAHLLKAWFLDESTRMNPHLNYAQGIPGITEGRGIGVIDMWYLYRVIDSIQLIKPSAALSTKNHAQIRQWFTDYLEWLTTSPLGIEARDAHNNHGTFYALQTTVIALFVNQPEIAKQRIEHAITLLDKQIDTEGLQPHELERTRPFHYSVFNLQAFVGLASVAQQVNTNLWHHPDEENARLQSAINYILERSSQHEHWGGAQEKRIETLHLVPLIPELVASYQLPAASFKHVLTDNHVLAAQCALLFGMQLPDVQPITEYKLCPY